MEYLKDKRNIRKYYDCWYWCLS